MLHRATGILKYENNDDFYKLIVEVDPNLALFYRSLIPKYKGVTGQRYPPHISVVRKEIPPNLALWGKYEESPVDFVYDSDIQNDDKYWWLNAFSTRLEEIRVELGLPVTSPFTRPPSGFLKCFHITLGNTKAL